MGGNYWIRNQDPSTRLAGVSPGFLVEKPVTRRSVCQFEQKKHEIKDIFTDWGRVTEFLPSATMLRQGNVFTPVCHSVHGGVCLSASWDTDPSGRHPTPWADTPLGRPPKQTPPGRHTLGRPPSPPAADGYCSGLYASYWNAFLLQVDPPLHWIRTFEVPQIHLIQSGKNTKMFKKETPKYTD